MSKEDCERYERALHGMQSGVAFMMNYDTTSTTPKHLRVGVNAAMSDMRAVCTLLLQKGIITQDELEKAVADAAELEVRTYEERLSEQLGKPVRLA